MRLLLLTLAVALAACSQSETVALPTLPSPGAAAAWDADASEHRGDDGLRVGYDCPPAPATLPSVWGTDLYTDDSSVCAAGVHAGAITAAEGGRVTIEIRPGADGYAPSARNGVGSREYGAWGGSFVVVR